MQARHWLASVGRRTAGAAHVFPRLACLAGISAGFRIDLPSSQETCVVREFETDPEALFEFTQQLKAQSARSSRFQFVNSARLGGASRPEDIEGKRTLTNTECANLLHPKPRGFNKVARVCWGPAFAAAELL